MKSALVLTNHLHAIAGSEILAIEVAEELKFLDYNVTVGTNVVSVIFKKYLSQIGIQVIDQLEIINLLEYDFIWSQHFVAPLCKNFNDLSLANGKFFSIHLSPYESLELVGLSMASGIANALLANSEETKTRIQKLYEQPIEIYNFNNAAPRSFRIHSEHLNHKERKLKNILVISNHIPKELEAALRILFAAGYKISIFGIKQRNYRRILPSDIINSDAVISIGKSVQYSILSKTPVYCYDRFGGPGWITSSNDTNALKFNFSGRCCKRKITPEMISHEIIYGFERAALDVEKLFNKYKDQFDLLNLLKSLENFEGKLQLPNLNQSISTLFSDVIRRYYRASQIRK